MMPAGSHPRASRLVLESAFRVDTRLGPGLPESAYEACLAHEIRKRGLRVRSQVPVAVVHDDVRLDIGFRIDLLVEDVIVIEVKGVKAIECVHCAQLLSYLRRSGRREGLLFNFHSVRLRDGFRRLLNDRARPPHP